MAELALDQRQRDPLVQQLDRVRVAELMIAPTSAQSPLGRPHGYAEASEKSLLRSVREAFQSAYSEVLEELQ